MRTVSNKEIKYHFKNIVSKNPNIQRMEVYKELSNYNISKKIIQTRYVRLDNLAKLINFKFKGNFKYRQYTYVTTQIIRDEFDKLNHVKYWTVAKIKRYSKKNKLRSWETIYYKTNKWKDFEKITGKKLYKDDEIRKYDQADILRKEFKNKVVYREDLENYLKKNNMICLMVLSRNFKGIKNLIEYIGCKYTYKKYKNFQPIGKRETKILDHIEIIKKIKIDRQVPVYKYIVDGYDRKNNVVYEVDEIHHRYRKQYDQSRDKRIVKELDCEIIRIDEISYTKNMEGGSNNFTH